MKKNPVFIEKTFTLFFSAIFFAAVFLSAPLFAQGRNQEEAPVLEKVGTYKCGRQPKQVLFSPDDKYIIMPLLEDTGFDIFSMEEKKVIRRVLPPNSAKQGFAEGLFLPQKGTFLVSQMTTGNLYEYSYPNFEYKRTIPTGGTWSKFIAYSPEKDLLAVSNWISNDVSLIEYGTGKIIRLIKTGKAPRGLAFLEEGKTLLSLSFESGIIEKFSVEDGKRLNSLSITNAAMRHIVLNKEKTKAFISNMYHAEIYELDLLSFKISRKTKVYVNPNTIDLLNDRYLFVSSRGYNNPADYTKRSPYNGRITIIDTLSMKAVNVFEGGNQPTGLAVSNSGKFLCFSNFQDQNIEIYSIK